MILVDANIPMYMVGADHPNKIEARRLVQRALSNGQRLVTDAEVLQEICRRYAAIGRYDAISPTFDSTVEMVDQVLPIELEDVAAAKDILLRYTFLSARDAIHAAIMERHGIDQIMSFDAAFDRLPVVERLR